MATAADDDRVICGFGLGLAPHRLPALVPTQRFGEEPEYRVALIRHTAIAPSGEKAPAISL